MKWLRRLLGGARGAHAATNPGRLRADLWRLVSSYPVWPGVLLAFWILSLVALLDGFDWGAVALFAVATLIAWRYLMGMSTWFMTGDLCPGVVVNEAPLLVAALNDLTLGDAAHPAVRIRREPKRRFSAALAKAGKRVACVARFDLGAVTLGRFINFTPLPVPCATADSAKNAELLARIPAEQWRQLQAAVKQLPRPFQPGLYLMDEASL